MIIQTDIFDFLAEKETKWFFNEEGFVDVEVRIPSELKSPFEVDKMHNEEYKRWSDYCLSIQSKRLGTWNEAKELLIKHRKNRKPLKIRIFKRSDFRPIIEE